MEIKNIRGEVIFTSKHAIREADLREADLREADLREVDLREVDLRNSNLSGADLRGAIGNGREVKSMQIHKWSVAFTQTELAIGCQQFSISEWKRFSYSEIYALSPEITNEEWDKWKGLLFDLIDTTTP